MFYPSSVWGYGKNIIIKFNVVHAYVHVWKTSWGGWASSIVKVLHIHVVHYGTILIDCVNWLSSMQENCQTKLQVFHGRLELVSTWCECGDVWQWMVDIQSCIYGYYLMFGLYPQSMKYFTALNEPHEEAWRKRGIILLHQSLFTLRCQRGVVHSLPPSTHSLSVFNTLV